MNCEEIRKHISEYIEGDLPQDRMTAYKSHIDNCPGCQKEIEEYKKTWQLLGEWEDVKPGVNFLPDFWNAVEKSGKDSSLAEKFRDFISRLFSFRIPAWGAVTVMIIALLVGHFSFPRTGEKIVYKDSPETRIVYIEVPAEISTLTASNIPGDASSLLPSPMGVLEETLEEEPATALPAPVKSIEIDGGLEPVNLDDLFEDKQS
ncbi:MAG: zf-HC2 domain-containing protein [Candidatus Eremiobacteraeota bacterium]|nr:zf-HC2 domain-containing protein [Candidatus Eremiobacteraeota bacterium]